MKGLTTDSDVLPAPQLVGEPGVALQGPLGSAQQALLLAMAEQVKRSTSAGEAGTFAAALDRQVLLPDSELHQGPQQCWCLSQHALVDGESSSTCCQKCSVYHLMAELMKTVVCAAVPLSDVWPPPRPDVQTALPCLVLCDHSWCLHSWCPAVFELCGSGKQLMSCRHGSGHLASSQLDVSPGCGGGRAKRSHCLLRLL